MGLTITDDAWERWPDEMKIRTYEDMGLYTFPVIQDQTNGQNPGLPTPSSAIEPAQDISSQIAALSNRFEARMSALEASRAAQTNGGAVESALQTGGGQKGVRGGKGGRGTHRSRGRGGVRGRGRTRTPASQNDAELRADKYDDDAEDVCTKPKDITEEATAKARKALVDLLAPAFRLVCGVSFGQQWPDPTILRINSTTEAAYVSPFFEANVDDPRNEAVTKAVAQSVWDDLSEPDSIPEILLSRRVKWSKLSLQTLAKGTFRGMRSEWRRQNDDGAARRAEVSKQRNRHYSRRVEKAENRLKACGDYAKQNDEKDASETLHQEYMSDEVSGPEDGSDETPAQWKVRMAELAGMQTSGTVFEQTSFLEVLTCEWKSEEGRTLHHTLTSIWRSSLSPKEKQNIDKVRVPSARSSSRIPERAPWNFMIYMAWVVNKRQDAHIAELYGLQHWGRWGNPVGMKILIAATESEPAVGVQEIGGGAENNGEAGEGNTGNVGEVSRAIAGTGEGSNVANSEGSA
ncbi:hypothetical protein CONPUDRAFT_155483 [Coniophora puteana RWD-64-598 SS2]|uniref:Uncharacterized protein n=1 Tax=Coniophora puteana (strain RWD-64-598) TaxID=741705 RepID=A0A5M3MMX6_CONPW|nr:uncharacterized protein CONPUDRAFT_155483 [Coniophora puteana RWD-64-598 SS2]EIW80124.1 hypothetical protein CONPUDRAFT_155483 [Coniophora puteana RWD-64-598 SS2]